MPVWHSAQAQMKNAGEDAEGKRMHPSQQLAKCRAALAPGLSPSTAFRHLPPNPARICYTTEGALFISKQLSSDAVSALRKIWVLRRLWKQHSVQARM